MSKLARNAAMVSILLKAYSERTGCRTIDILVRDDATDKLLNLVKGLKDMRWCAQLGGLWAFKPKTFRFLSIEIFQKTHAF